ncbi:hypothetical protein [Streptomyces sp. NPDC003952]
MNTREMSLAEADALAIDMYAAGLIDRYPGTNLVGLAEVLAPWNVVIVPTEDEAAYLAELATWSEVETDAPGKEWRCELYPSMRITQANEGGMFWIHSTRHSTWFARNAFLDRAIAVAEAFGADEARR